MRLISFKFLVLLLVAPVFVFSGCEVLEVDFKEFDLDTPYIPDLNIKKGKIDVIEKKKAYTEEVRISDDHYDRIEFHINSGRFKEMHNDLIAYLNGKPNNVAERGYYLLARCLIGMGEVEKAKKLIHENLGQFPMGRYLIPNLHLLKLINFEKKAKEKETNNKAPEK